MTTQIVFKIDPKLKKAAQKRAAQAGITLSDLFQSAAQSFVAGKVTLGLIDQAAPSRSKQLDRAIATYVREKKAGRLQKLHSLADLD